jgi:hypothetical protein
VKLMPRFPDALQAWPSASFSETLKREIEALSPSSLPLEQGLSRGNYLADEPVTAMILRVSEDGGFIQVDLGLFFSEINAGCSCGFDPLIEAAYCEFRLTLSRETGEGEFRVAS